MEFLRSLVPAVISGEGPFEHGGAVHKDTGPRLLSILPIELQSNKFYISLCKMKKTNKKTTKKLKCKNEKNALQRAEVVQQNRVSLYITPQWLWLLPQGRKHTE